MTQLRRSRPSTAGWTRRRRGRGFEFRDQSDRLLQGPDRARCVSLAIPPAWTDVWICPWPNGHIQAMGTDALGRRQYLYHPDWRDRRDRQKFQRMVEFGRALPTARQTVSEHLAMAGMPRERGLATAFRLLDRAGLRVGGEAYQRQRGTVGVATLLRQHAATSGDVVRLRFPGKSGREQDITIHDAELAAAIHQLLARRKGGRELLAFQADGRWVDLTSTDINEYIRAVMGADVTAKDFRTWQAALYTLSSLAQAEPESSARRAVAEAMRAVSHHLGNTPTVARNSYVDPRIVSEYLSGAPLPVPDEEPAAEADMSPWEEPLLRLLGS